MTGSLVTRATLADFQLWPRLAGRRKLLDLHLELTARCNNDCRHCYINRSAEDTAAAAAELSWAEIGAVADEAVSLGAVWALLTGGEPLLRGDFTDIYLGLKRKGLLVSVFTNATLVSDAHVQLFRRYPPREVEVTVYGATAATYERVTRRPGSYDAFRQGIERLARGGVPFRMKAMVLRTNRHEAAAMAALGRRYTRDYFYSDPLLHLRYDGDPRRNRMIRRERLTPAEVVAFDRSDDERSAAVRNACRELVLPPEALEADGLLFTCGAGHSRCYVSSRGEFRLCSALCHPDYVYDLTAGSLSDAWNAFVPRIRRRSSRRRAYLDNCRRCRWFDLCMWCPAHALLETGAPDRPVDYFCRITRERVRQFGADFGQRGEPPPADRVCRCRPPGGTFRV